jgi:glycerol-3-phosphate acyltransferase PlsY
MLELFGLVALGYLIGSIPFAVILARLFAPNIDLRNVEITLPTGAKHKFTTISATTLSRGVSPKLGGLCSVLDMLKAIIPMWAVMMLYPGTYHHLWVSAAIVAGHNWPVFNRFQGGSGFSPILGSALIIDWLSVPVAFLTSLLVHALTRSLFVGFIALILVLAPWLGWRFGEWQYAAYALGLTVIYLLSIIPDARQYLARIKAGENVDGVRNMSALDLYPGGQRIKQWLNKWRKTPIS